MLSNSRYQDTRLQAFYTDADEIALLVGKLLGDVSGKKVIEPAIGRGAFLKTLRGTPALVDGIDVDVDALKDLRLESPQYLQLTQTDFIQECMGKGSSLLSDYDAVIANPPYGLRFSKEFRRELKALLPDFYVRESYGLFLRFGIERLTEGGRYSFLLPDTFLTSNNHRPLRRFLAEFAKPSEIVLFDSRKFGTVQFGYGSFCIIAGNKGVTPEEITWLDLRNQRSAPIDLPNALSDHEICEPIMRDIERGWVPPRLRRSDELSFTTLGKIAECRTGIYTGDNPRFLGFDPTRAKRRTNGHPIHWESDVAEDQLTPMEKLRGIAGSPSYVPFIRGGHRTPFEKTAWAIDWSENAVACYASDKKARLQNARFYFQRGLAVPMVTSGRLSASLMEGAVFDQGVVGVFPEDPELVDFLLLYLNSSEVSQMKKTLNASANNSAGYLKRLPMPEVSELAISEAKRAVRSALGGADIVGVADSYLQRMLTTGNISPFHP